DALVCLYPGGHGHVDDAGLAVGRGLPDHGRLLFRGPVANCASQGPLRVIFWLSGKSWPVNLETTKRKQNGRAHGPPAAQPSSSTPGCEGGSPRMSVLC